MTQDIDFWKGWPRRLKAHLKKNGLNLAKLAEKMIDDDGEAKVESTLRSWTNGNRNVNLADFFELCQQAGADPVQILFGRPLMSETVSKHIGALATSIQDQPVAREPAEAQQERNRRASDRLQTEKTMSRFSFRPPRNGTSRKTIRYVLTCDDTYGIVLPSTRFGFNERENQK